MGTRDSLMVLEDKSNSEEAQAEAPALPPMNGRLVTISNVEIAVDLAKQCTSPRLRAQHRESARRMHDALARELARVRLDLEALEAAAALDGAEAAPRQASLFGVSQ